MTLPDKRKSPPGNPVGIRFSLQGRPKAQGDHPLFGGRVCLYCVNCSFAA